MVKKVWKRVLACVLAFILVAGYLPIGMNQVVNAEESDAQEEDVLKFGDTDTYLQLSNPLSAAPQAIEATVNMPEIKKEWILCAAEDISFSKGVQTETIQSVGEDVTDGPEGGTNYAEVTLTNAQEFVFSKKFDITVPYTYSNEDVALSFWIYSDTEVTIDKGYIELTSSGTWDHNEIDWGFLETQNGNMALKSGWNYFELPVAEMFKGCSDADFNLQEANFFRWHTTMFHSIADESTITIGVTDVKLVVTEAEETQTEWTLYAAENISFANGIQTETLQMVGEDVKDGPASGTSYAEVTLTNTQEFLFHNQFDIRIPTKYSNEDVALSFWLYSDTEVTIDDGRIELTSSGTWDKNEIDWSFQSSRHGNVTLKEGWNYFELPVGEMYSGSTEAFNLQEVNFIRWHTTKFSSIADGSTVTIGVTDVKLVVTADIDTATEWMLYAAENISFANGIQNETLQTVGEDVTDGPASGTSYAEVTLTNTQEFLFHNQFDIRIPTKYSNEDVALSFWLYSDTEVTIDDGRIELTSSGTWDKNEIDWSFQSSRHGNVTLKEGWNYFELPVGEMYSGSTEAFNLQEANFIRWHTTKFSSIADGSTVTIGVTDIKLIVTSVMDSTYDATESNYMIFSNLSAEDETCYSALMVTKEGKPAFVWGDTQYTLNREICNGTDIRLKVVRDSNGYIVFYINDSVVGENFAKSGSLGKPTTTHCIGGDAAGGQIFNGSISNLKVYSDAILSDCIGKWALSGDVQNVTSTMPDSSEYANTAVFRGSRADDWSDYTVFEDSWSLVYIPDMENLTSSDAYNATWKAMAKWIADNAETENIQHVIGGGDITLNNSETAYARAMEGYELFMNDVSWSTMVGYNDYEEGYAKRDASNYQTTFSEAVIQASATSETYKGSYIDAENKSTTENSYYRFHVNGVKWMILQLEYDPRTEVLEWADEIIKEYPLDNVILTTQGYLNGYGSKLSMGTTTWEALGDNQNIKMILCGYSTNGTGAIVQATEVYSDGTGSVPVLMMNAQDLDAGEDAYYTDRPLGMISILRFSADGTKVAVQYYSATEGKFFSPDDNWGNANSNSMTFEIDTEVCTPIIKPYGEEYGTTFAAASTPKEADIPEGYVFAGWFTNEACTTALQVGESVEKAYAKFVDAEVLSVKAQVRLDNVTGYKLPEDNTDMRFITTVDSTKYKEVGFKITANNAEGQAVTITIGSEYVYEYLYAVGMVGTEGAKTLEYTPSGAFSPQSTLFKTFTVTDIPMERFFEEFTVRAYWITLDGTTVVGDTVFKTSKAGEPWTGETNPQIVTTLYTTEDVVVADIIPTEATGYAVDPTGKADSTDGIQKALWDCFYAGGGTVYLPAGNYLITDTIYVPSYVTLRGDYQNPDTITDGEKLEYGTIILADISSVDSDTMGTFILRGSSGVAGLTVYYPKQSLTEVLPYPYTFYVPTMGTEGSKVMTIQDVTVINGYRGIGTQYDKNHESLLVDNFKGTFLKNGLALHNQSDVGRVNEVTISNKYWAEASADCMANEESASIETYMKSNTVGILASSLEWTTFSNISIESCQTAVQLVDGARTNNGKSLNAISIIDADISNCVQELVIDSMDPRWGSVIARSSIDGEIDNNTTATVKMTDVDADIKEVSLGTLFACSDFSKTSTTGTTSSGTATATSNGQQETFSYKTFTRGYSDDAVVIKNEVTTTLDLSGYEWEDLAIEFWMKCSNASVTSFETGSYLRIGTGTAGEEPYLEFKRDDITLTAGAWTKLTLNLCDADSFGNMTTDDKLTWAYLWANGVGDYSWLGSSGSISISDIKIVEANIVENATDDLSSYTIDYDATYTKPKEQLFVAELQKGTTTDVSTELQSVLNQAEEAGGGIVYVPGGTYRLDNPIVVPAGVELRGTSAVAAREQRTYTAGTLFLCYYGDDASYNAETDDALITLNGENAGVSGLRIIYPENGSYQDNLNTTYTIRGKAAGVYVVNCSIMASAYGVDFRNCDNHFIKGVYTCCWYNTFRLGGDNGVVRDCLHNGNLITRTNADGLPKDWPTEGADGTNISDLLSKTAQYIIIEDASNELVLGVSACSTQSLIINKDSEDTLAVNVCSDKMGDAGIQFTQSGGSMTVINAMRCQGTSYSYESGTLQLFNRICIKDNNNDAKEENVTID